MRLYRKRPSKDTGKSVLDLMKEMLFEVREWFPTHETIFVADGFYAPLAKELPEVLKSLRHGKCRGRKKVSVQIPPSLRAM